MKRLWQLIGKLIFWAGWPGWWLYLNNSRRTRLIIISNKNRLLIEKAWIGNGDWMLPGGGLHGKEDPKAGAVRETYEETGVQLRPSQLMSLTSLRLSEYGWSFDCLIFVVHLPNEPAVKLVGQELTDAKWVSLEDVDSLSPVNARVLSVWKNSPQFAKIKAGN